MSKFDHEQVCQSLGMYDECSEDDLEECPHCGEWVTPEIDNDDVVFCPECHMDHLGTGALEGPQGVDVGDVPF